MKVVINNCFGGFGLSPQAVERYAELSGFKVYGYQTDYNSGLQPKKEKIIRYKDGDKDFCIYWIKEDLGSNPSNARLNKAQWLNERDIKRDDKNLVQVVQELGEKANGRCADLKIVEIPDGIDYEISEYDGNEHIAEKHRTWS